jgi:glycosyltransferase involved in cell wall biosynthesis
MIENNVVDSKPKNEILVSILVPVYGVESYIERCAHSLFQQTFTDIEYIFVNDCTQDNSISVLTNVLSEYKTRIKNTRIINHTINKGISEARQTALQEARGKFILFVDSDDYIELNMVELLYQKAVNTNADMVICSFYNEYSTTKTTKHIVKPCKSKVELVQNIFAYPSFWNKLFKRELLTKFKISFPSEINYGEDLTITPRLIYYSSIVAFVEKPLYHYIHYNNQSYTSSFSDNKVSQSLKVIEYLDNFFANKTEYKNTILYLKAIRKAKILRSGKTDNQYITLFPEIKEHLNELNLDIKTKIILQLSEYKMPLPLKLFVKLLLVRSHI